MAIMYADVHIHIALNRYFSIKSWNEMSDENRDRMLKKIFAEYRQLGITTLRDGGDNAFVSYHARRLAMAEGIVYKSPVYAIYKRGCYGSFLGKPVSDLNEIKKELVELSSYEPDHIKIVVTGLVDFQKYGEVGGVNFTFKELSYISDFAKERGLPLMVHANGKEGVSLALKAGISTLEHGYLVSEAELYGMAEAGITWVPTLSPLGNILEFGNSKFEKSRDIIQKVFNKQLENIRIADALGVKISLGSDAGAYLVGHGNGLFDEMRHFESIGCFSRSKIESMCRGVLLLSKKN
ncbi:MAG: amidohydrolase family protein [Bacillota bacterium]